MHLRRLTCEDAQFVHSAVQVRLVPPGPPAGWFDAWLRVIEELIAVDGMTLSKRVVLVPGEGLDVLLQALAPAALGQRLRDVMNAISLPGLPYSRLLPNDDVEFQRMLDAAPASRALLAIPRYAAGDLWFACPFRAADAWPRVAGLAHAAVGYQVNLYPYRCSKPMLRAMSHQLDSVSAHPAISARMRWLQRQVAERARHARWLQEDLVLATGPAESTLWSRQVHAAFHRLHTEFGSSPELQFSDSAWHEYLELTCSFDETLADDPSYVGSQVQDAANATMQLGLTDDWDGIPSPAASGQGSLLRTSMAGQAQSPDLAGTTAPSAFVAAAPYVFLSYAHADSANMRRVLALLRSAGIDVWVDERLEAGQEWDAQLEAQIRGCAMLVALISPAASASRWVRRELKYADSLGKPLTCLRLCETTLTDGLGLLLLSLQWIDAAQVDADERLIRAAQSELQRAVERSSVA